VGNWEPSTKYWFPVAEAQGAMMANGTKFVLVGGFLNGFRWVTRSVYTLNVNSKRQAWIPLLQWWQRQDRIPIPGGVTHAALVVVGETKFYLCGGYIGGSPGPHTDRCLVWDSTRRRTRQWSFLPSLPDGGRGGGGMVYDSKLNALIFAGGAQRPTPHLKFSIDFNTTWLYALNATDKVGWVERAPIPFTGNHLSFVTARDANGTERHFFSGGQRAEDEAHGNNVEHFEYNAVDDVWIPRRLLTLPRGHASSSTRAVGCGYLVAAGATNGGIKTADVSYYDISTDTWTSIGALPKPINTPVCDIGHDGMLYCESGFDNRRFSHRIRIEV
jgi:Kelch motif